MKQTVGTTGNDYITGAALQENFIQGGDGAVRIFGGGKGDVLSGGAGADTLDGGLGNDTYVFNVGDGADTVVEAMNAGTDTLQLGTGLTAAGT